MINQLLELENGTLVEVELEEGTPIPVNSTNMLRGVQSSIDKIQPILINISNKIAETFSKVNRNVNIEKAEIEARSWLTLI